jgi:hypothetical protein
LSEFHPTAHCSRGKSAYVISVKLAVFLSWALVLSPFVSFGQTNLSHAGKSPLRTVNARAQRRGESPASVVQGETNVRPQPVPTISFSSRMRLEEDEAEIRLFQRIEKEHLLQSRDAVREESYGDDLDDKMDIACHHPERFIWRSPIYYTARPLGTCPGVP